MYRVLCKTVPSLLVFLVLAGHAYGAEPLGSVTALTGKAASLREGQERPLANGDPVLAGDLVRTEAQSRITLRLGERTTVNLGPGAKLRLEAHLAEVGGVLDLVEGGLFFDRIRMPAEKPTRTEIKSPYGLIAVRGTRFFAGPSGGRFGVFVAEGEVEVTGGGRTVRLAAGRGSDIARPGAAPSPPRRWSAARIRAALLATTGSTRLPPRR